MGSRRVPSLAALSAFIVIASALTSVSPRDFSLQVGATGFVKIGVIIDNGPPGTPDSVWARDPTVLQEPDGSFKMWYNGFDGGRSIILLATSSDGFSWTKQGAVLDYGGNAGAPFVLREGSTYHMWFQAGSIFHAVSQDGRSWTVDGIALAPNYPNWDGLTVGTPWVVQYGGQYQMYFMGSDGGTDRIGLATSSTYWNFTRVSSSPVFEPGGTWDSFKVRNPAVKPGNPWIMYYAGLGNSFFQVGIATSPDGVGWTRGSTPILAPDPSPSWDSQGTVGAKFIDGAHGRRLYYTGSDGSRAKIGLAVEPSEIPQPAANPWQIPILVSIAAMDGAIGLFWYFVSYRPKEVRRNSAPIRDPSRPLASRPPKNVEIVTDPS